MINGSAPDRRRSARRRTNTRSSRCSTSNATASGEGEGRARKSVAFAHVRPALEDEVSTTLIPTPAVDDPRYDRARRTLEGGVDSPVRAGKAVGKAPPMIVSASAARVVDADGRTYLDYQCAYGPVLLGHALPVVTAAVTRAMAAGAVFGSTHPEEVRLAERLAGAIPSMERIRFVSTGTEACASALRVA